MNEPNYHAIYQTALLLHELSGDPDLCSTAMRCCSAHGIQEATDWLAVEMLRELNRKLYISNSDLRQMCEWAITHKKHELALECFRRSPAELLDDLKWDDPENPAYKCPRRRDFKRCNLTDEICSFHGDHLTCPTYGTWQMNYMAEP